MRNKTSLWWLGISSQITTLVENCSTCAMESKQGGSHWWHPSSRSTLGKCLEQTCWSSRETTICSFLTISLDIWKLLDWQPPPNRALKMIFSCFGIPKILRSDNGPQNASKEFEAFAKSYRFQHVTSSLLYPRSNGLAEHMVQTAKQLLSRSDDPKLTLLDTLALLSCWWDELSLKIIVSQVCTHLIPN